MTKSARSVSPQSKDEEPVRKKQKASGLSRLLGFFKSSLTSSSKSEDKIASKPIDDQITTEIENIDSIPLVNEFTSTKKKRLSIQGHVSSNGDHVPRSVSISNNLGFYQTYYNSIQTDKEELSNDLERRLSTAYDNGLVKESVSQIDPNANNYSTNPIIDSLKNNDSNSRDISPVLDIPTRNNSVIKHFVDDNQEENDEGPMIIEHEFAPLYTDGDGNLARPPFINLDPRERYHLLQLKRSIEASESLQNRLKYMVDPKETESLKIAKNKVETATQTHNISYMENSLNFPGIKLKLTNNHKHKFRVNKKQKNSKGFFSGELLYDLAKDKQKVEKAKIKNKLDGYLGSVNKPEFKDSNKAQDSPSVTKISIGNDQDKVNKFNLNQKKTINERIGLDNFLVSNNAPKLTLDPEYITQSDKISNIIKLKEIAEKKKATTTETVKPSSGFKFEVNKSDINEIIDKRKQDQESTAKFQENTSNEVKKPFSFGLEVSETKTTSDKPTFSFGANKETSVPKLSIGTPASNEFPKLSDTTAESAPKFSFGKTDKPVAETIPKLAGKLSEETPKFSFGKTESNKEAFSFGKPRDNKGDAPSLFGASTSPKVAEAPKFAFGGSSEPKKTDAPKFSFGAASSETKADAPKLSFGTTSTESKPETPKLSFGASVESKESKAPTFSFGAADSKKSETPKLSFGASNEKPKDDTKESTPTFSFGNLSAKPAFSLGGTEKSESVPPAKPAFSFGKPETSKLFEKADSAPLFSFGAKTQSEPKRKLDDDDEPRAKKATTSLGATNNAVSTPPIGNGEAKPLFGGSDVPSASSFSFKPKVGDFNFGSGLTKDPKTVFGTPVTDKPADKPLFGQASQSKQTTPFENKEKSFTFGGLDSGGLFGKVSKPVFNGGDQPKPAFSFTGMDTQDNNKPFGLGSATPSNNNGSRTGTPFGIATNASGPGAAPGSVFGSSSALPNANVPSKSTFDFLFGGGTTTPTAPHVAAPTAFAATGAPAFFNRSASSTPPVFGGFPNNNDNSNGMNMNMNMGMNANGMPGMNTPNSQGMPQLYTPPIVANRNPNRKIAPMRPRRR